MNNKYMGYYKSPIGILEIVCDKESVLSCNFVDKEEEIGQVNLILESAITQLDEYFKGERKEFDLKVALYGTEFQKNVWNGLLNIPYGTTVSYKDIAVSINNEKAVRAVGNANNKNKISIIVPCHRVIGKNGALTGYAGGLDKKQWLLDHENRTNLNSGDVFPVSKS